MSSQNKAAVEIYQVTPLIKDCLLKLHSFLLLTSGQSRMNNMFVSPWRDAKFKDSFWLIKLIQAISQKSCLLSETKRNWFNPESTCCSIANFILKHIQDKWERRQMTINLIFFAVPEPSPSYLCCPHGLGTVTRQSIPETSCFSSLHRMSNDFPLSIRKIMFFLPLDTDRILTNQWVYLPCPCFVPS